MASEQAEVMLLSSQSDRSIACLLVPSRLDLPTVLALVGW